MNIPQTSIQTNKFNSRVTILLPILASLTMMFFFILDKSHMIDLGESFGHFVLDLIIKTGIFYIFYQYKAAESYLDKLYHCQWQSWFVWLTIAIVSINLFDAALLCRLNFFYCCVPILLLLIPRLHYHFISGDYHQKVSIGVIYCLLGIFTLPGVYFPPFYSGIAGWASQVNRQAPVDTFGVRLVTEDGRQAWLTTEALYPNNFYWRQIYIAAARGKVATEELFEFYWKVYQKQYPYLGQGKDPTTRYTVLGYPHDTLTQHYNYADFQPEKIRKLIYEENTFDPQTKQLLTHREVYTYDVKTKQVKFL